VSDPEPDSAFRKRLLRVVAERDRQAAMVATGAQLDRIARAYDLFRTGVPLKGFDGFKDGGSESEDA
jgi:hypothetical protein